MKYYFSSEKLEGDNKYDCRKCKQYTNAVKSLTLKDPPHNLIVNLKKFDINGAKIKAKIEYPYNFNLGDYIKPTGRRSRTKNSNMYELYAVINHEGYYSHWGHYNWYVKSFEDNWFRCDDSKVKKIGSQNQTSSEKAYILFYRLAKIPKKTTKRKVKVPIESESKEESKSLKSSTTKSSTVNRKRKKETKPAKSDSSKLPESKKRAGGKEKKTNWVMSEVVKSSGSCSKRFKKAEADNFDTSAEISI